MSERVGESLLSFSEIVYEIRTGNIIVHPFNPERVKTVSIDVTLGSWYFRPNKNLGGFYNPWDETSVRAYWGRPQKASLAGEKFGNCLPKKIYPTDKIIMIYPGELLLCHTQEFIGGKHRITTMMKARSSIGRSRLSVCKCAGWGDVGYFNRWTMEVESNHDMPIPLIVGEPVAQLAFFRVSPIEASDYSSSGKYQTSDDLETLVKNWRPDAMLPKLWKDR